LFSDRGYHGTGMEHIAAHVGLSPSSLYNHWKSKQELLQDIMVATMDDLLAGFDAAVSEMDSSSAALSAAMQAHVRYHATHHRDARIGNREIPSLATPARDRVKGMRHAYAKKWEAMISLGVAQGRFAAVSPQLAAYALLEMGIGVSQWYRPSGRLSLDLVAKEYGEMALRLVGSDELG
jgi:AcrR family transcriptional regulator